MNSIGLRKQCYEIVSSFKKNKIVVIGDLILDRFIFGNAERISPEAPVPVVCVDHESYVMGGALNVVNNIRSLGGDAYPCGVVGRDYEGSLIYDEVCKNNLVSGKIFYDSTRRTTLKTRIIAQSQQIVRFDRENISNISKTLQRKIIYYLQQKISSIDAIIIVDHGGGAVCPHLLTNINFLARRFEKPVLINSHDRRLTYYGSAVMILNDSEAYSLYGNDGNGSQLTLQKIGNSVLKKLKISAVLIAMGKKGCLLFEKKKSTKYFPSTAHEIYDASGVEDVVIATFCLALASGANMFTAAMISNIAANIVIGKLGMSVVNTEELLKNIENDPLEYKMW